MSNEEAGLPPPRMVGSVDSDSDATSAADQERLIDDTPSLAEKRRHVVRSTSVNELEALKKGMKVS